jgi:hypothetical protein
LYSLVSRGKHSSQQLHVGAPAHGRKSITRIKLPASTGAIEKARSVGSCASTAVIGSEAEALSEWCSPAW